MHKISLAPVLSATRSRDSCWITSLRFLEYLRHAPPLGGRKRSRLHQQYAVANTTFVALVVRLQLAGATHRLAVQRVLHSVLDPHDDGLVHLVADDNALASLAEPALDRARRRFAHVVTSSATGSYAK